MKQNIVIIPALPGFSVIVDNRALDGDLEVRPVIAWEVSFEDGHRQCLPITATGRLPLVHPDGTVSDPMGEAYGSVAAWTEAHTRQPLPAMVPGNLETLKATVETILGELPERNPQ